MPSATEWGLVTRGEVELAKGELEAANAGDSLGKGGPLGASAVGEEIFFGLEIYL